MFNRYPHVANPIYPPSKAEMRTQLIALTREYHNYDVKLSHVIQPAEHLVHTVLVKLIRARATKMEKETKENIQPDHSLVVVTKKAVPKKANGGNIHERGNPIHFPRNQSLVGEVEAAMELFPDHAYKGAKELGISEHTYSFLRKLVTLRDDPLLAIEDRQRARKYLNLIEHHRRIGIVRAMAHELIERCWIKRKDDRPVHNKKRRRFDAALIAIRESCASTTDMALPQGLKQEEIAEAINTLGKSITLASKLIQRLAGGTGKEDV